METFSTSPESLHVKSPDLLEMFLIGSSRSVVTFESYSKSSMASAWQRHFFYLCKTTTSYEVTILARNVPLGFLKKCCYFWNDFFPEKSAFQVTNFQKCSCRDSLSSRINQNRRSFFIYIWVEYSLPMIFSYSRKIFISAELSHGMYYKFNYLMGVS